MDSRFPKAEATVAMLLTTGAIWLHLEAVTSAGGLWRDEASTVGLATLPALGDVWKNLQYDSIPILWLLIVRGFSGAVGPMNDTAFRILGFCVGVGVLAAVWFYARTFRNPFPLVSLALLGMSPSMITWGDSMRAYGFGILLILLEGALIWRFVEHPSVGRFLAASVTAIASVHTLYYNSVLLLAFCAGAVAVCVQNRTWKRAFLVVLIGALAAVSLFLYAATIRSVSAWNMLLRIPSYTWSFFWLNVENTLQAGGSLAFIAWLEALAFAVIGGVRALGLRGKFKLPQPRQDVALFSFVALVTGVAAVFLFLRGLSYLTQPWYYLTLLAMAGVCMDALIGALIDSPAARLTRLIGVLLLAAATFLPVKRNVRTRLTNIDLIASRLDSVATPGDLVLVTEWPEGVSFQRYYRGSAQWATLPLLGFQRFHRYDLIGQYMLAADQSMPIRLLLDNIAETLRNGHRVFGVGGWVFLPSGQQPVVLRPATRLRDSRQAGEYLTQWSSTAGFFIQRHATTITSMPVSSEARVSPYENALLIVFEGWRP